MSRRSRTRLVELSARGAAAALLCAGPALANGRYPAANMLAFDPIDGNHLVLAATFGLLESHDAGQSFFWRCESALGIAGQQDIMIVVTASGATVAAKYNGVVRTADGCSFEEPSELLDRNVGDLTLFRSAPHSVAGFYVDARAGGGFESQLIRSDDDGHSWTPLGSLLPPDVLPLTIDAAPSDGSRIYLSVRLGSADDYASALLRSADGGQTFERSPIPESAQHHMAYIAAVHPSDANRIYVRVWNPSGTAIWISDDGGTSFRKVFTGADQILGFAVSPDGSQIAFGGPGDGIWIAAADGTNPARRSDVRPNCLAWNRDGLFACADMKVDAFSLGRSRDDAVNFEPVLTFRSLCGQTGCGVDAAPTATCADDWTIVGPTLGAACLADGGASDAGAGDDPPETGITAADTTPNGAVVDARASGGGCAFRSSRAGTRAMIFVLIAAALARRARRAPI